MLSTKSDLHSSGMSHGIAPRLRPLNSAQQLRAVARRRDRDAFRLLFDHYAPRVKAYLKHVGADDELAEDLAQEVMLAIWRKADKYDPAKASVGTWIFTIARNVYIDALRREQRPELDPNDPLIAPVDVALPDAELDAGRREALLRGALRGLPREQAAVITLSFYSGQSHGEIAATLGIPLGTVKTRLRLAFRRIRGFLRDSS